MIPVTQLVTQCAPFVAPSTMTAIVRVESGGNPLVILDNTTGQNYYPRSAAQGAAIIRHLLSIGHSQIDVGIAQVDTENFAAYGLTPTTALNACTNIRAGARILQKDYQRAIATYGPGQAALYHAFEAYNSGRLVGDPGYADKILAAAGVPVFVQGNGHIRYRYRQNYHPFVLHWKDTSKSIPINTHYRLPNLTGAVVWR
ncbi:lytic transglycosylase domain-containing protein [Acidithiobacillus thiooxidans]|uniref:lytic transglycosylase domain-containing protein n=1 Tax=Acidithiobacillus thiooxidans TaxID=930 RepID=UPI001C07CD70|nr:lytic transglycosylase domain-containing protein [Acidithiobacillus thiooxidans]MBU2834221.1 lytic transglycosylase domain-containing protein [Acidithiobacillus thiooxidans]